MDRDTIRKELVSTAQARLARYDGLIALAQEQQAILAQGRHADLAENTAELDPLLLMLHQLDEREMVLQRYMEREYPGQPAFSTDTDPELASFAYRLSSKAAELRALTEINKELLNNVRAFTDFSISIICQLAAEHLQKDGGGNPAIVLDRRV